MAGAAANGMTRITLSFLLSLLSDNNLGPNGTNTKHHWSYKGLEGPQNWPVHYKGCAGLKQSPIDIRTSHTMYDDRLGKFHLDNFHTYSEANGPTMLNVTNNGHAASVRVTSNMRVSGGGLNGTYKTAEFHFHWGSTDDVGSEHAVDGRKFPLEMHIVNYAEKYGNIKDAMTEPDGLAVFGVFFELSDTDNLEFSGLGNALTYVQKAGEHNIVHRVRLRSLLPDNISRYWRYSGSLTTPMCFESVTWTVFTTPQKISRSQLATLRSLLHENGHDKIMDHLRDESNPSPSRLVDNWRPVQPLNDRTVYRSFDDSYDMSNTRQSSSSRHNAIVGEGADSQIIQSAPSISYQVSDTANGNLAATPTTGYDAQRLPSSISYPSKSKLKMDPTSIPKTNAVASFANPTASSPTKSYKDSFNVFPRTQLQTDAKGDSLLDAKAYDDYSPNKNADVILQLQKQQKLIELQTQQQIQKLMQLQQQREWLNKQLESQQLGGVSALLPSIQNLDAQPQQGRLAIQSEGGTSVRNGVRILNDGVRRGDQAMGQTSYQSRLTATQQRKQSGIDMQGAPNSQTQQRYVKPIDPNFLLDFRQDGFAQPNQQSFIPRPHQRPSQQTLLSKESPTPSYNLNSQFQPQRQGTQLSDATNSLFSHLRNPQVRRQNSQSGPYHQQVYRTYQDQQSSLAQRQGGMPRQQSQRVQTLAQPLQQQIPGSSKPMSQVQLRSFLETLTSSTRQSDGPQLLMSPAARMLPPIGDVNSISRQGSSASARGNIVSARDSIKDMARTAPDLSQSSRTSSTLNSGMNPIPYASTNQRLQRVPSSQTPTRLTASPSSSPTWPSSAAAVSSLSSPSSSYTYRNQQSAFQQFSGNPHQSAGPTPFNRRGVNNNNKNNNNWFFTDASAHTQARHEEHPPVFLHHMQKPVRIRRPFYERLYNL